MDDAPDDLAPLLEELARTLEALRDELGPRRPGPVRDSLRFTERYAIPAVVTVLEANVRLLELTADAIRLTDERGEAFRPGRERATRPGPGSPAEGLPGPRPLDALDAALDELGDVLRGVPTDPDARRLLEEVRDLRREVRTRLDAEATGSSRAGGASRRRGDGRRGGDTRSGARRAGRRGERRSRSRRSRPSGRSQDVRSRDRTRVSIPVEEEPADASETGEGPTGGVAIDVDAELESIKRDLDGDDGEGTDGDVGSGHGDAGGDDEGPRGEGGDDA